MDRVVVPLVLLIVSCSTFAGWAWSLASTPPAADPEVADVYEAPRSEIELDRWEDPTPDPHPLR